MDLGDARVRAGDVPGAEPARGDDVGGEARARRRRRRPRAARRSPPPPSRCEARGRARACSGPRSRARPAAAGPAGARRRRPARRASCTERTPERCRPTSTSTITPISLPRARRGLGQLGDVGRGSRRPRSGRPRPASRASSAALTGPDRLVRDQHVGEARVDHRAGLPDRRGGEADRARRRAASARGSGSCGSSRAAAAPPAAAPSAAPSRRCCARPAGRSRISAGVAGASRGRPIIRRATSSRCSTARHLHHRPVLQLLRGLGALVDHRARLLEPRLVTAHLEPEQHTDADDEPDGRR